MDKTVIKGNYGLIRVEAIESGKIFQEPNRREVNFPK